MIRFEGVSRRFAGADRPAVDGIDLDIAEGTTCVLIGPSGCGKSTTLRMVNRLVEPDAGRILLDGRDVAGVDPVRLRRGIGYVLQGIGLFPHRTVAENVATVPKLSGWSRARIADRVDEMLALVGLDPRDYRDRRPDELSGGQRQTAQGAVLADEAFHEGVGGGDEEAVRRAGLGDPPLAHQHDAITHPDRLVDVVSDDDDGLSEPAKDRADLAL